MDISEADKSDALWSDQFRSLASGVVMSNAEINKALDGDEFYYFSDSEASREKSSGISIEDRNAYFTVFHYSEEFGLPHGKGWIDELPWTIQFLNNMKYIKRKIEIDQAGRKPSNADSINPQSLAG